MGTPDSAIAALFSTSLQGVGAAQNPADAAKAAATAKESVAAVSPAAQNLVTQVANSTRFSPAAKEGITKLAALVEESDQGSEEAVRDLGKMVSFLESQSEVRYPPQSITELMQLYMQAKAQAQNTQKSGGLSVSPRVLLEQFSQSVLGVPAEKILKKQEA